MSIKKSLIAIAATALALMGFASSAMAATDGVVRDVDGTIIPANKVLHFVGWAEFVESSGTGLVCHVTSSIKTTGIEGKTSHVETFTVPDTTKCTGTGALAGCKLKSHVPTNLPWHVTVTPTDFDVTGNVASGKPIEIHNTLEGFLCPPTLKLTLTEITLKPLKTKIGTNPPTTGTLNNISKETATAGEPIAGVELSGKITIERLGGTVEGVTSGELELTAPDRCTYKIGAS